ncbi:MAG: response regulator [Verrucomicrobia bacterium]|nr:response regulator [Verrucomicrobiota bacterium]
MSLRWLYQRRLALVVTLAIGIGASLAVFFVAQRWEHETLRIDYEVASNDKMLAVKRTLQDHVAVLDMLGRFCEVTKRVDRGEFQQFIRHPLNRDLDIVMMAWLPRVTSEQRELFQAAMQTVGPAGFKIVERDAQGKTAEAGHRAEYFPVLFAEPFDRNKTMLGADFNAIVSVREASQRASKENRMVAVIDKTGVFAPSDRGGGLAKGGTSPSPVQTFFCLLLQPVYKDGEPINTAETRRESLLGFAACVFDIGKAMENTLRLAKTSSLDVSILDTTTNQRQHLYKYLSRSHAPADEAPLNEKRQQLVADHGTLSFALADRQWSVVCTPTRAFLQTHTPEDSSLLLACGLMATVMLAGHLLWIMKHAVQTEQLVVGRTSELAAEVAKHKQTAAALQESEKRYRTLFENSADALLTLDERMILDCNATTVKMFRYACKDEFLRLNPAQLSPPQQPSGADSNTAAAQNIAETFEKGLTRFDWVYRRQDGEDFLAEVSLTALELGGHKVLLATVRDVTEHRKSEEQLRLRDSALNATVNGVLIADNRGKIVWVNPSFTELTGYSAKEALGQSMRLAMSGPEDHETYEKLLAAVQNGESWRGEVVNQRKDGAAYSEEMTVTPVRDNQNTVTHFIAVIQDVSDRKRAETELLHAKEAAEAATKAKSDFLASMSHEIRTPMNGVIGMTGLLLDTQLTPEQREYARIVRNCGNALLMIINDILDFSKIELGKMSIEPMNFNLRQAVEEVTDMLLTDADDKGIELIVRYTPKTPSRLVGDPGRIRQVLTNLVGNAIKFTEKGHVLVSAECEELGEQHVLLRISVQDTGIGIPEEKIGSLFQRFSQVDASATRRYGGTGLGLAISRELVELMGGTIGVQSQPGQGSTFWFKLRLPLDNKPDPMVSPKIVLKNLRMLIVDDNEVNRRVLEEQLGSCGARTSQVVSGRAGLRAMHEAVAAKDPFQIAIVDFQMPEMDGIMFGRAVKADPLLKNTVLVMLSSAGQRHLTPEIREAGFAACLSKAVYASQLIQTVADAWRSITKGSHVPVKPRPLLPVIRARVLVAEDNVANQKVAARLLEKLGCRVDVAATGAEAVRLLRLLSYDIVFMDCQMPEMDGYEATREIRRQKGLNRKVPIVAMTANAMAGDREGCLAAGMDDYVAKPVELEQIVEVLKRWVRLRVESEQTEPAPTSSAAKASASGATATQTGSSAVDAEAIARLRELSEGDPQEFLKDLLGTYITDTSKRLIALQKNAADGNARELMRAAHAIKGSSLNVGANLLADYCQQVEEIAATGSLDGTAKLVAQIEREFERVKTELNGFTKV